MASDAKVLMKVTPSLPLFENSGNYSKTVLLKEHTHYISALVDIS